MESVADALLDEQLSKITAMIDMKLAAAKSRLRARLAGLGAPEHELVLTALATSGCYLQE